MLSNETVAAVKAAIKGAWDSSSYSVIEERMAQAAITALLDSEEVKGLIALVNSLEDTTEYGYLREAAREALQPFTGGGK